MKAAPFQECRAIFDLLQYNYVKNLNGNCLDLIFSSFECEVDQAPVAMVPQAKYHPALMVKLILSTNSLLLRHLIIVDNIDDDENWNIQRSNLANPYFYVLTIDWKDIFSQNDVHEACLYFFIKLRQALVLLFPIVTSNHVSKGVYSQW